MNIYRERDIKLGRVVEGKVRHIISQCYAVNKKQGLVETIKKIP